MTDASAIESAQDSDTGANAHDCAELGALLGLDGPVSQAAFNRAANDSDYARKLIICRETPAFRDFLLAEAEGWTSSPDAAVPGHSAVQLAAKAATSFWGWARSGFATLDPGEYEARFAACLACPNLVAAPDRLVYRLAGAQGEADRHRVCGLCGCVAARKAGYPHEHCPGPDPARTGFNRWGQPLASANPD